MHVTFLDALPYILAGVGVLASVAAGCLVLRQGSKYRRERLQIYVIGKRTSVEAHRGPPEEAKDGDTWVGSDKRLLVRRNGFWVEPDGLILDALPDSSGAAAFKDEVERRGMVTHLAWRLRNSYPGELLLLVTDNPLSRALAITMAIQDHGAWGFDPVEAKRKADKVLALGHNGLAEAWAMAVDMVREEGREYRRQWARIEAGAIRSRNMVKGRPWLRTYAREQRVDHQKLLNLQDPDHRKRAFSGPYG